jgi:hypothetical protein
MILSPLPIQNSAHYREVEVKLRTFLTSELAAAEG